MLKVDGNFRRGDVTHMQAYIELGNIMSDYWGQTGAFKRAELLDEPVVSSAAGSISAGHGP